VCASPQILVLDRSWNLAQKFATELTKQLNDIAAVEPFYPGTQERLDALKKNCPGFQYFPKSNLHVIFDVDADDGGGDYMLKNEIFGPAFGIKYIDGKSDLMEFQQKALEFANNKLFGSLSCTIIIDKPTNKKLGKKFEEEFLYNLNWGTIALNISAAAMVQIPYGRWGAPTNRHDETDIQSGIGGQGNCLLFENVQKAVIRSSFGDPIVTTMFKAPNSVSGSFHKSYSKLHADASVSNFIDFGLTFGKSLLMGPTVSSTASSTTTATTTTATTTTATTTTTTTTTTATTQTKPEQQ